MGLDLLDLSFRIEQRFGFDLPPQSFAEMAGWSPDNPDGRPFDVTVGQLYEFLLARLEIVGEGESRSAALTESRPWTPREVWDELEEILVECLYVKPDDVRPGARLVADLGAQ
jgi:acyl carrier protein